MLLINQKQCLNCHELKPIEEFRFNDSKKKYRRSYCRICDNIRTGKSLAAAYASVEGRSRHVLNNTKSRAKKFDYAFNLELADIQNGLRRGHCQRTNIAFDFTPPVNSKTNPFAPSIDRINAAQGYVKGNVQFVCNMFNMGKSDHSELDFIAMCVAVAELHKDFPVVIARLKELRDE